MNSKKRNSSSCSNLNAEDSQRQGLKKVKVLSSTTKEMGLGQEQPLLSASHSQKNVNLIKAHQQMKSLIQNSNSVQSFDSTGQSVCSPANMTSKTSLPNSKRSSQYRASDIQSSKMVSAGIANLITCAPKQGKKFTNLKQKASAIMMGRCYSLKNLTMAVTPGSIVQGANAHQSSLSPDKIAPHFQNLGLGSSSLLQPQLPIPSKKKAQQSLSPNSREQNVKLSKQNQFRVKSFNKESMGKITRTMPLSKENSFLQTQQLQPPVRHSPDKQFIVKMCNQAPSQEEKPGKQKNSIKLQKRRPQIKKEDPILEQEEYLLPCSDQNREQEGCDELNYSLNRQFEKMAHYDYNLNKYQLASQNSKPESEEEQSMNKGFMTDRNSRPDKESQEIAHASKRKTKGSSYTKNALELKKILQDTCFSGSGGGGNQSSTANACPLTLSTQDTQGQANSKQQFSNFLIPTKPKNIKVANCPSARNLQSKQVILSQKHESGSQPCEQTKKPQLKIKAQADPEFQAQTLPNGQHQPSLASKINFQAPALPQTTTSNLNKQRNLTFKDQDLSCDLARTNTQSDQVIFQSSVQTPNRQSNFCSFKKSEGSSLAMRKDISRLPLQELENTNLSHPYQDSGQAYQKYMQRSLTANNLTTKNLVKTMSPYYQLGQPTNQARTKAKLSMDISSFCHKNNSSSLQKTRTIAAQPSQKQNSYKKLNRNPSDQVDHGLSSQQRYPNPFEADSDVLSCHSKEPANVAAPMELQKLQCRMLSFVKSYKSEFQMMKKRMMLLEQENKFLKQKLGARDKKRPIAADPSSLGGDDLNMQDTYW